MWSVGRSSSAPSRRRPRAYFLRMEPALPVLIWPLLPCEEGSEGADTEESSPCAEAKWTRAVGK